MDGKRIRVRKSALYHGYKIGAMSMDEPFYYVASINMIIPPDLFIDQASTGRLEYWGKLKKSDPELVIFGEDGNPPSV